MCSLWGGGFAITYIKGTQKRGPSCRELTMALPQWGSLLGTREGFRGRGGSGDFSAVLLGQHQLDSDHFSEPQEAFLKP